jgi:hypothetical protein
MVDVEIVVELLLLAATMSAVLKLVGPGFEPPAMAEAGRTGLIVRSGSLPLVPSPVAGAAIFFAGGCCVDLVSIAACASFRFFVSSSA